MYKLVLFRKHPRKEVNLLDGFEVVLLVAVIEVPSIVKPLILPAEFSEDLSVSVT